MTRALIGVLIGIALAIAFVCSIQENAPSRAARGMRETGQEHG
jgi:hypothetical protein